MTVVISIVSFIVAIGILITVHEFGHFWMARRLHVRVLRFSIGFGRPFWHRLFGTVQGDPWELALAPIPLGGYVKMLDGREEPIPAGQEAHAFDHQSIGKRSLIVLAGPLTNLIFAVFALAVVFTVGFPAVRPILGQVPQGSYAARAHLHSGDIILAVDGHLSENWGAVALDLVGGLMHTHVIRIRYRSRKGLVRTAFMHIQNRRPFTVPGHLLKRLGFKPGIPSFPAVIKKVLPGSPAASAGIESGDRIVSIAGLKISDFHELARYIENHPTAHVKLVWQRQGRTFSRMATIGTHLIQGHHVGFLGIEAALPKGFSKRFVVQVRDSPLYALVHAFRYTVRVSSLTLSLLYHMLIGQASLRNISGPIRIAQYAGATAQSGWVSFLSFLAIVSISLGLFNLLPIPILDGGHLLYYVIEVLQRKPLSARAEWIGQQIGIGLLVLVMGLAFYNDLVHLF
ncbi:MAG: RIP metalloprotease RseP [Gammaproteobacteria bacterium]